MSYKEKLKQYNDMLENNRDMYQKMISEGLSINEISKVIGMSFTATRYRFNKLGIKSQHKSFKERERIKIGDTKKCKQCNRLLVVDKTNFYIQKNGKVHAWCKECNDRITYQAQIKRKQKAVDYKGGKCSRCGYNKYIGSLDFHHMDPSQKDFNISQLRTYSWKSLKKEVDKCICVCKNCHAEIHYEIFLASGKHQV